jgi:hypothetical protein
MIRGGFLSLTVCLASAACCRAQQPSSYSQPYLDQGVYDLTTVYGQASAAWAEDRRAYSELNLTVIRLRREFADSPDYKSAIQDVQDAQDALDAARTPVLTDIAADPHHADLAGKYANVSRILSEGGLPLRDLLDLAARKMEYGTAMHLMEAAALGNDPAVRAARDRLVTAQRKVDGMREKFDSTMYQNPRWAAAKQAWDNAEISLAGAEGAVVGANVTACLAVAADQRHQLYNFSFGNFYNYPAFIDASAYYGRRY